MSMLDIRVEKGRPRPEEVAAMTAVLLARAAARASAPRPAPSPGWRRLGFRAPHSWQGD